MPFDSHYQISYLPVQTCDFLPLCRLESHYQIESYLPACLSTNLGLGMPGNPGNLGSTFRCFQSNDDISGRTCATRGSTLASRHTLYKL